MNLKLRKWVVAIGAVLGAAFAALGETGVVPAGYTRLDFIRATGEQWIATDYKPSGTDRVELKVQFPSHTISRVSTPQCLFCARGTSTTSATFSSFLINGGNTFRFDRNNTAGAQSLVAEENVDYEIVADGSTLACTVNGTQVATLPGGAFSPGSVFALFASHEQGMALGVGGVPSGNWGHQRLYYFRVYNAEGKLVREYLPARDDAASPDSPAACGVYETQTGVFCPNRGAVPFMAAKPVLTLTEDQDWRDRGPDATVFAAIDLNGHTLKLSALSPAFGYITDGSTGVRGELQLDLADDLVLKNSTIGGNLKVVKSGAGTLTLEDGVYGGVWNVLGGTLVQQWADWQGITATVEEPFYVGPGAKAEFRAGIYSQILAPWDAQLVVEGGELELVGRLPFPAAEDSQHLPDLTLRNGAVLTLPCKTGHDEIRFRNLSVADSEVRIPGLTTAVWNAAAVLHGTITTSGHARLTSLDAGRNVLVHTGGVPLAIEVADGTCELDAATRGGCLKSGPGRLVLGPSAAFNEGMLTIAAGTFTPPALAPGDALDVSLTEASILDLAAADGPVGGFGLTLAGDAATVTVDVHGRELASGTRLLTWASVPENVTFVFDAETAQKGVAPATAATGLFYGSVPADEDVLILSGEQAAQFPIGTAVSYAAVQVGDCTLTADCDWRGLGVIDVHGTIDLKGHKLFVAGLAGTGTITDSTFDLTTNDPTRVSNPTENTFNADAKPVKLFSNNFAYDYGQRVLVASDKPFDVVYDFGEPTVVNAYRIFFNSAAGENRGPKVWAFYGSTDGVEWTELDARNNTAGWYKPQVRGYRFDNETPYTQYRLSITANCGDGSWMEFYQLEYGNTANGCGELHVDVPAGAVNVNGTVTLSGNLAFVKEGAGDFVTARAGQFYAGGTRVLAGRLVDQPDFLNAERRDLWAAMCPFGDMGSAIVVGPDATFDIGGHYAFYNYDIQLQGGTLTNSRKQEVRMWSSLGSLKLLADAFLDVATDTHFRANDTRVHPLLNGKTLTVSIAPEATLSWRGDVAIEDGTLKLQGDGVFQVFELPVDARTVDFEVGVPLNLTADLSVRNYLPRLTDAADAGTGALNVYGKFVPAVDAFYGCTLQDGATLDLSDKSGVWSATGTSSADRKTVTFAAGATVTIDVHGRTFAAGEQIIAWAARPKDVTFVFDAETAAAGVAPVVGESGLYYGESTVVDAAVWTGAAGDGNVANPANWSCTNPAGKVLPGGLPCDQSKVSISGAVQLDIPAGSSFASRTLDIGSCALTGDCDWRGLDTTQVAGTIDVKGHKLQLSNLSGTFTVTDSTGYQMLDYIESTRTQWIDTEYTPACTDKVVMELCFTDGSSTHCLFCARGATTSTASFTGFLLNGKFRFDWNDASGNQSLAGGGNIDYTVVMDGATRTCTVNGVSAGANMAAGAFTVGSPFSLFVAHHNGMKNGLSHYAKARLYSFRVYNVNGELVREFLPVCRLSDDAVGVYETITGKFHGNSGTGTFLKGGTPAGVQDPGELVIDVAEDATVVNETVSLQGYLKLVKTGKGTFVANRKNQTYAAGTVVREGVAKVFTPKQDTDTYSAKYAFWGVSDAPITVESGAEFDIAGNYDFNRHPFVLAGGTLANRGVDQANANWSVLGAITLTADSFLAVDCSLSIRQTNAQQALDLGGHTLRVRLGTGKNLLVNTMPVKNGTVAVSGDGLLRLSGNLDCRTANFVLADGVGTWLYQSPTVHDYITGPAVYANRGNGNLKVTGTFAPRSDDFAACELQDGATLDLSRMETTLPEESPRTLGDNRLTFAPAATIEVNLLGRSFAGNPCLLAWNEKPADVTFRLNEASRRLRCRLVAKDDGLHYSSGLIIIIR